MKKKQTAVEYIMKQFNIPFTDYYDDVFNKALQMEKEQISKAWDDGDYAYFDSKETGRDFENGEEYYNEKYGKS